MWGVLTRLEEPKKAGITLMQKLKLYDGTTPGQIVIGQDLMPKRSVYNYPNPTEGGSTTIRYSLNQPADVNIRIYDLAGDFIEEMAGAGNAPADNEVTWNLGNVASGVYFARVEARGQTSTDIAIIKIAVVK
jgi:hypothetical protein